MEAATIRAGDIVQVNVRGDKFFASVQSPVSYSQEVRKRVLEVKSLTGRPIPTKFVTPRQIVGHWRQSRRNPTKE